MKKIGILILTVLLSLTGCQEDKGYLLKGNVDGLEDGKKVFVLELDAQTRRPKEIDTTRIKDGKFEVDMAETDLPNLSFLRFEGVNGNVLFISENETISFDVDKDSIRNTSVSGGKENKALYEYLGHLTELNRKVQKMQGEMRKAMVEQDTAKLSTLRETQKELEENDKVFKKELFERSTDTYLSVMILTDMMNTGTHTPGEIRDMFEQVSERIKKTPLAQSLKENLDKISATEVGSKAPDFTAPTPEGEELALSESLGKVTVVDFWAAWCKPCRVENPNLVRTYNKYKDQGLNIISVSLDRPGQKDKWLQAIEDDNLQQWDHVSNLQFWNDPIVKTYGIRAIPATFVLNEEGVIVAKNLRGDELSNKIGELLQ